MIFVIFVVTVFLQKLSFFCSDFQKWIFDVKFPIFSITKRLQNKFPRTFSFLLFNSNSLVKGKSYISPIKQDIQYFTIQFDQFIRIIIILLKLWWFAKSILISVVFLVTAFVQKNFLFSSDFQMWIFHVKFPIFSITKRLQKKIPTTFSYFLIPTCLFNE